MISKLTNDAAIVFAFAVLVMAYAVSSKVLSWKGFLYVVGIAYILYLAMTAYRLWNAAGKTTWNKIAVIDSLILFCAWYAIFLIRMLSQAYWSLDMLPPAFVGALLLGVGPTIAITCSTFVVWHVWSKRHVSRR